MASTPESALLKVLVNLLPADAVNKVASAVSTNIGKRGSSLTNSAINRSIRKKAGQFVLSFPMISSDRLSFDALRIIRRNLEFRNANDIITYLSNTPVTTIDTDDDVSDPSSILNTLDSGLVLESTATPDGKKYVVVNEEQGTQHQFENAVAEVMKENSVPFDEMFNMDSLNEATLPAHFVKKQTEAKQVAADKIRAKEILQAKTFSKKNLVDATALIDKYKDQTNSSFESALQALTKWKEYMYGDKKWQLGVKERVGLITESQQELPLFTLLDEDDVAKAQAPTDKTGLRVEKVTPARLKEVNEYQPIYLDATRRYLIRNSKDNGAASQPFESRFRFAVKEVAHTISSTDAVKALTSSSKNSNFLSMVVRWTSGEIKLFSDLLLKVNDARDRASFQSKGGRSLNTLNSYNQVDYIQRQFATMGKGSAKNRVIPNAALVVTRDDIEEVRSKSGIDMLYNTGAVTKFMASYLLVDFIVVDEPADVVYIFDVSSRSFDKYSLSSLSDLVMGLDSGSANRGADLNKFKTALSRIKTIR